MINDGGDPVIRAEGKEFRLELLPLADIDTVDLIGEFHFLERDRDFVAIRGRGVVKFNHGESVSSYIATVRAT